MFFKMRLVAASISSVADYVAVSVLLTTTLIMSVITCEFLMVITMRASISKLVSCFQSFSLRWDMAIMDIGCCSILK